MLAPSWPVRGEDSSPQAVAVQAVFCESTASLPRARGSAGGVSGGGNSRSAHALDEGVRPARDVVPPWNT